MDGREIRLGVAVSWRKGRGAIAIRNAIPQHGIRNDGRPVFRIINTEMAEGMAWCMPDLEGAVFVEKEGLTAHERQINPGLRAIVLANPGFGLGTLIDL